MSCCPAVVVEPAGGKLAGCEPAQAGLRSEAVGKSFRPLAAAAVVVGVAAVAGNGDQGCDCAGSSGAAVAAVATAAAVVAAAAEVAAAVAEAAGAVAAAVVAAATAAAVRSFLGGAAE